jgi:hypothetical protein
MANNGPLSELCIGFAPVAAAAGKDPPSRFLLIKSGDMDWAGADLELDDESAEAILAEFDTHGTQLPIDYHHATLQAEETRGSVKAPAAGWIKRLEYMPGEGIYAVDVEWTDEASAEIKTRAFKYVSPVVNVNKKTGKPVELHSVALTNRPRTRGMIELLEAAERAAENRSTDVTATATKTKPKGTKVDAAQDDVNDGMGMQVTPEQKAMVKLAEVLGLGDDAGLVDILNAALEKLGGEGGEPGPEEEGAEKVAAALGLKDKKDTVTVCAEIAKLKAKAGQYDGVVERVNKLETEAAERVAAEKKSTAEQLVDEQIEAGKLLPNMSDEAKAAVLRHAETDPEGFKLVYASMPAICPPGQVVTASSEPGGRARVIAEASKEYDANPKVAMGAPREAYIDASLEEAELSKLTDAELKKVKGGE